MREPLERPLLAVLIDADNIPAKHAEAILEEIRSLGEPALRRVYGDWSSERLKSWSGKVLSLGLVAHQQTANTKGKNASDIGLVIDAMDHLHSGRFDGFVLVSSDSDFTALANRIREQGLDVIGIGEGKTPDSLKNVCTRFILIENIVDDQKPASAKPESGRTGKQDPTRAVPLIRSAMNRIDADGEWYDLGMVGQFLLKIHPNFDPRTYGKPKLSELIGALKGFETRRGERNEILVRRLD